MKKADQMGFYRMNDPNVFPNLGHIDFLILG